MKTVEIWINQCLACGFYQGVTNQFFKKLGKEKELHFVIFPKLLDRNKNSP